MKNDTKDESKSVIVDKSGENLPAKEVQPRRDLSKFSGAYDQDPLIAMAIDKDLDIDKLKQLIEIREREEEKTAYTAFIVAISNFQAECPTVKKTGSVADKHGKHMYNYPKFDSIMKTIQPHMDKNNLSVRFSSDISDGQVKVHCMVSHVGGHTDDSYFSCPIEATMVGGANASQRTASANSFAKRYAIMNALNIAGSDFDDDGQSLVEYITEEEVKLLRDDLKKLEGDEEFFCNWLKVGCLEEIPVGLLKKAQSSIEEQQQSVKAK